MCPVVCSAVNLLTTQEDKLCDFGYLEFEVVTEHLILDVLIVGSEERKRGGGRKGRKEGREEEGGGKEVLRNRQTWTSEERMMESPIYQRRERARRG